MSSFLYVGGIVLEIIKENDKTYPEKLRQIYDRPAKLYVKGNIDILNNKSIAIIGSRNCSKYGMEVAYKFGYGLAKKGITIISGLARGIDAYSHWGTVKANGKAIAVLGSGFNNIYPKENIGLYKEIIKNGGASLVTKLTGQHASASLGLRIAFFPISNDSGDAAHCSSFSYRKPLKSVGGYHGHAACTLLE